jgi:hypothetical protein
MSLVRAMTTQRNGREEIAMRDLPLVLLIVVVAVLLLSTFTDVMPPAISNPARGLYNQGVLIAEELVRVMGVGVAPEYFLLLPMR